MVSEDTAMPPIKGKMMGRMGRSMQPAVSEFQRVKSLGGLTKKKARMHLSGNQLDNDIKDDKLLKLRYPTSIRQILPSVKRFKGGKSCQHASEDSNSTISEDASEPGWDERTSSVILGTKRPFRGSGKPKYFLRAVHEEKFKGMIWDLAISPSGDIVVSCADGMFICGENLRIKQKLDTIVLAGGVSFLSDGRIIAICRNKDTVNIFSGKGEFLSSFSAGFSPMSVKVDAQDRLLVCDPGAKCVYVYSVDGNLETTIGPAGHGFSLRWPLYAACHSDSSILISDCHSQSVLMFDAQSEFVRDMKLATCGGNQVLRPHGICVHNNDIFLIDNATDSVEVFDKYDSFIQTLVPQEEGHPFRPKVLCVSDKFLVIGGLTGIVKLYKFITEEELDIKPHHKALKTPMKKKTAGRPRTVPKLKIEIKDEPIVCEVNGDSEELNGDKEERIDSDCESLVPDIVESDVIKPKLLNTEDDPVVLDSDSESEDESESTSENESENQETKTMNSSFVVEHVSENVMEFSDPVEEDPEEELEMQEDETENGEKIHVDEVIILDDE